MPRSMLKYRGATSENTPALPNVPDRIGAKAAGFSHNCVLVFRT